MAVSRPNYFTGQFLKQTDFLLEQDYHKKLSRLHNRYHHTVGVVTGLEVKHRTGTIDVTVSDGVAMDKQGRTIVLDAVDTVKSFSGKVEGNYYVVISYEKEYADETEETGVKGFTRVNEKSLIEITTGAPDATSNKIALAKVIIEDNAGTKSIKSVDTSVRKISGAIAGESLTIAKNPTTVTGNAALKVDGDAYITGKVGIGAVPSAASLNVAGNAVFSGNIVTKAILNTKGYPATNGGVNSFSMEIGGANPSNTNGEATVFLHHHSKIAHQLRYNSGNLFLERAGNGYGTSDTPNLLVGGSIGVGTTTPQNRLHVRGVSDGTIMSDGNDRPGLAITGHYPQIDLISGVNNPNHGSTIRLGSYNDDSKNTFKHWVIGTSGRNSRFLDIGFSASNDPNPHAGIRNHNGSTKMTLLENGNIGIGATEPSHKFHVKANGAVGLFESTSTQAYLRLSTREGLNNRVELCNRAGGRLALWTAGAGDVFNVLRNGNVGVGTISPGAKLDVNGFTKVNYLLVRAQNTAGEGGEIALDGSAGGSRYYIDNYYGNARIHTLGGGKYFQVIGGNGAWANKLRLGNKFLMSGIGDAHGNDDWLRLFNVSNTGYYGGLAAGRLWTAQGSLAGSDLRLKKNISKYTGALDKIKLIRGVQFSWKKNEIQNQRSLGFIAQEVEEIFPEAVKLGADGCKAINYSGLLGPTIEAIKEINTKVDNVHSQNLEQQITLNRHTKMQAGNDFAEYFKSVEGNAIDRGISVVLEKDKVRPAKKNETPLGVISSKPNVLGGNYIEWPEKYLKDAFGSDLVEEYKEEIMTQKIEKVKHERQKIETKTIEEEVVEMVDKKVDGKMVVVEVTKKEKREVDEPQFKEVEIVDEKTKEVVRTEQVPIMETYEVEEPVYDKNGEPIMVGTGKFEQKTRPKLNPAYDPKRKYIPRDQRPEWNIVGLVGQIPLRKGQPTAPGWVKLKDIDKDVELWLVK